MEKITAKDVNRIHELGGVVWPYPKKGRVSLNGFPAKPATPEALQIARKIKAGKLIWSAK